MPTVEGFYDNSAEREWQRLERHRTEYSVTMRALTEYLPPPPARVLDVGGGPGRYSITLTQMGYGVTLLDLSRGLLEFARAKAGEYGVSLESYVHGNALDLSSFSEGRFDAVLLMGPLYHLVRAEERQRAVAEAYNTLRRGGVVFASAITRYAPIRSAAVNGPDWILERQPPASELLSTGMYISAPDGPFTDAYFAMPTEVAPLLEGAGFETLDLIGCEGVISLIEEAVNETTGKLWEAWVDLNYRLGKDPSVHGAVEHLLYIGRKNH